MRPRPAAPVAPSLPVGAARQAAPAGQKVLAPALPPRYLGGYPIGAG